MTAIQDNIRYLLESFSADDLLHPFRQRLGKATHGSKMKTDVFSELWEEKLAGSNAGRFLMGAGNTLRWVKHDELRSRMNFVVDGIAEVRASNGYIMAYPEDTFFVSERGAYTRAWLTHGLIEAGYAGNDKAFELLRGYYDWYNQSPYLPLALRGCNFGPQGTVANTRMYFTPVGKPKDLQVVQRYLHEDYWLEDLAARKPEAIWQYPYDRPHCYVLTFIEAYLDLYRATGERRYLDATLGGWDLFRDNWQTVGGTFSIMERQDNTPKSNPLYEKRGETCGTAFWILLNQRLHSLAPDEEKYVAEIERSIYNVLLANQAGADGIRYHTTVVGRKEKPYAVSTCCEGQGTRLLGSLPELIYSIAADGVYVNLFEGSRIRWQQSGQAMQLDMETDFPRSPLVKITVHAAQPMRCKIRIRTPSWASRVMEVRVNETQVATGTPGSYVTLDREWSGTETISFVLPITFRMFRYAGVDQVEGRQRYSLEYGPILMAALDSAETELVVVAGRDANDLASKMQPVPDRPLRFSGAGATWMPYFEVANEYFSCVPIIKAKPL